MAEAFFNQVIAERKTPAEWQRTTKIPNPADCANYRPIRLLSHSMKMFERIIQRRIGYIIRFPRISVASLPTAERWMQSMRRACRSRSIKKGRSHCIQPSSTWKGPSTALLTKSSGTRYVGTASLKNSSSGSGFSTPTHKAEYRPRAFRPDFPPLWRASGVSPLTASFRRRHGCCYLEKPAPWTLLYAVDVASEQKKDLGRQTSSWSERLAWLGLRLNVKKIEYMTTDKKELTISHVDANNLPRTEHFRYRSTLSADGNLANLARVSSAWLKWRSMKGVLCDKKIPVRSKSEVYRAVIRSVALYGAECWPASNEEERRLSVMEVKMSRWIAGTDSERKVNENESQV